MLMESKKEEVACIQMTQQHDTGPSLYLDLDIEGVPVVLMVDYGPPPSTIISRSLLHRIVQQMKSDGKPLPELSLPSV